ncbi:glycerophosphocholine cholinephosphodiesterase ENPP6-like [Ornithodoros turicata]|uniref:glycerophosphocholine cholinephosphodiesterase ENPP6-like n=1 Tax=Ornithodoros turicata TaxID=34597 RepID=UPI003138F331
MQSACRQSVRMALSAVGVLVLMGLLGTCRTASLGSRRPKLILVLVDGVRWDYLDEQHLPGFKALSEHGVKAQYVVPVMPANSYPNWYSIVTGLYGEDHGFVQNYMYDERHNDFFLMSPHPNASLPHWWQHAEPIWITAEKNGLRTAMYYWDGCQVEFQGRRPTLCIPYKNYWGWNSVSNDTRLVFDSLLNSFHNDTLDFGLVYYEGVDAHGHSSGPDSAQRRRSLRDIDSLLLHLQNEIRRRYMEHQVSLVVVSDHGMTNTDVKKGTKVIDIEPLIDYNDIHNMLDGGSFAMLRPYPDKVDKVYHSLKSANIEGLNVFKKNHLPRLYHLKRSYLTQPLVLTADVGYVIKRMSNPDKMMPVHSSFYKGSHGYDPLRLDDMRTIFLARGPGLKKGFMNEPVRMVDHYNLMCLLLGIRPNANSGNFAAVLPMLSSNNFG